jgi:hypothetical protein
MLVRKTEQPGWKVPDPLGARAAQEAIGRLARWTLDRNGLLSLLALARAGLGIASKYEDEETRRRYRTLCLAIGSKIVREDVRNHRLTYNLTEPGG